MRIHSMISVAQLEPSIAIARGSDSYGRIFNQESLLVEDTHDELELKRIIGKRTIEREIEYLIKWKGYDNQHNVWYKLSDLSNAQELIDEYKQKRTLILTTGRTRPRRSLSRIILDNPLKRGRGRSKKPSIS